MSASADLKIADLDTNFLPLIYEIIRGIEKDSVDVNKTSQEVAQRIVELHRALDKTREQLYRVPGLEYSSSEQARLVQALRRQITLKNRLIGRYQHLTTVDQLPPPVSPSCQQSAADTSNSQQQ